MLRIFPVPVPAAVVVLVLLRLAGTPAALPVSDGDDSVLGSSLLDQPPVCSFVYTPAWPGVGEVVEFDASASSDPNLSGARRAIKRLHKINAANSPTTNTQPTKPSSSPTTANTKSVVSSGTQPNFIVPLPKPLPHIPPAPIAVKDWRAW